MKFERTRAWIVVGNSKVPTPNLVKCCNIYELLQNLKYVELRRTTWYIEVN